MRILAIETSCDDTSAALVVARGQNTKVLGQVTASQIPIHRRFGGVVPEVAARAHAESIVPTIQELFAQCGYDAAKSMKKPPIDAIAVTCGPGLVTSLWVGVIAAKLLAAEWGVPVYGVNHMIGHLFSATVEHGAPEFPALGLIVSGGHTELVWCKSARHLKKIGATRDDAAGEAFDKFGKLLGLSYPAGPEIADLAKRGKKNSVPFPRPMLTDPSYDFSFAGLKTAGRTWILAQEKITPTMRANACASYEAAIVEVLVAKTMRAVKEFKPKTILLGGGVAANELLRAELTRALAGEKITLLLPEKKYTTDNAAMIAVAAMRTGNLFKQPWRKLAANPSFEIQ